MQESKYITIISNRRKVTITKSVILYVCSRRKYMEIHVCECESKIYKTFMTFEELERELKKGFVKVKRGCIVSERAIDRIADKIYLVNGEELNYTVRNKKEIVANLRLNTKLQIKQPSRGVYQIMNPGIFNEQNIENTVRMDGNNSSNIEENSITERHDLVGNQGRYLNIIFGKKEYVIDINKILYITIEKNVAEIHTQGDSIYYTRMSLKKIQEQLGDGFMLVHKDTLVSVKAIHEVSDKIYLSNGETLHYVVRKKKTIRNQLQEMQKRIIGSFDGENVPKTYEEYRSYYGGFEHLPFAFADIEMVFNEKLYAVDWIFRYGNPALAKIEKLPLKVLIGSSFSNLFSNMDSKWLKSYERTALYGEKLEMIDYSPEIDTYLKVICFPTFKGHCGCFLFNIDEIKLTKNSEDAQKALRIYFGELPEKEMSICTQ